MYHHIWTQHLLFIMLGTLRSWIFKFFLFTEKMERTQVIYLSCLEFYFHLSIINYHCLINNSPCRQNQWSWFQSSHAYFSFLLTMELINRGTSISRPGHWMHSFKGLVCRVENFQVKMEKASSFSFSNVSIIYELNIFYL